MTPTPVTNRPSGPVRDIKTRIETGLDPRLSAESIEEMRRDLQSFIDSMKECGRAYRMGENFSKKNHGLLVANEINKLRKILDSIEADLIKDLRKLEASEREIAKTLGISPGKVRRLLGKRA